MPIPYKHKRSTAAGVAPSTLQDGEIAINVAASDPKLFYKDSSSTIRAFSLASYASASHTHVVADVTDFTTKANVVSVNGITGVVSISHTDVTAASASHSHSASAITSGLIDSARLPQATTIAAGAVIVGTGLGVSSGTVSVTYGTNSTSACRGDDSRLSDTRTPTDGSVTTAKLANDAVTYAKLQNVSATDRLLGRSSAGSGDVEEITCTAFGRSLIDDADAAAARNTLSVQPTASPAFTGTVTAAAVTLSGVLLVTTGSASACGVAFSGDVNTGVFSPSADVFCISTSGSERMRVSSTGNVTIGEANSANARLMVAGGSSNISSARATYEGTVQVNESSLTSLEATGGIEFKASVFGSGYGAKLSGFDDGSFAIGNRANSATWSERLRINQNGEVLIGTTTDNGAYLLQVNSQIYATNATIATSDARFKTNVEALTDATAVIAALRPVAFDFIPHAERNFATERQVGLIAQEAQSALAGTDYADSVVAQCGDHLGLAYEKLVPVLIKALQESNARIAALEERLNHA